MINFAKRLLQGAFSLWLLATLTFVLMKIFPGSPYDDETSLHPQVRAQLEAQYGTDLPPVQQYAFFIKNLLDGRFGVSQFFVGREARDVILQTFPTTLLISFLALSLAIIASLTLSLSALLSSVGHAIYELITLSFLSMPILLVAPVLIYVFGFVLDLLPVALLDSPVSYILPVVAVALRPMASLSRLLYTTMKDNQAEDYIRTARAQGFSDFQILLKWNLRNSMVPFLAHLGPLAALLLAGSTMVEIVFAIPGLGTQFLDAVTNRDAAMVIGLTLFYGFFIIFFQLAVDLTVMTLDPRVRKSSHE